MKIKKALYRFKDQSRDVKDNFDEKETILMKLISKFCFQKFKNRLQLNILLAQYAQYHLSVKIVYIICCAAG